MGQINYKLKGYPCRDIQYAYKSQEHVLGWSSVSSDDLNDILLEDIDSEDIDVKREAENIEDQVAFYIPRLWFELSNKKIKDKLNKDFPDFIFKKVK